MSNATKAGALAVLMVTAAMSAVTLWFCPLSPAYFAGDACAGLAVGALVYFVNV